VLQVPVFVWAPEEEGQFQPGRCSRWWLMQSLRAFEKDLAALGSRLTYLRAAESRTALIDYIRDVGAQVRYRLNGSTPTCCAPRYLMYFPVRCHITC